jgi:glyoxylase-like metal-dependent hydrolase (beta-lactamase superfamily II)
MNELMPNAIPITVPTPWDVGPVTAYYFPDEKTFVDAATDSVATREAIESIVDPATIERVIVTHGHTDHFGGAVWLQEVSGCEVLMHPADIAVTDRESRATLRELFGPLGYSDELLDRYFTGEWKFRTPDFTPLTGSHGEFLVEHHPGHTPGHVWVTYGEATYVGDYLIADHPTNSGLELDPTHPTGRAPLLEQYENGLRALAERDAVLYAAHGPRITDHRALIERRLQKSARRTDRVLEALGLESVSPVDLGRKLYRGRAEASWEVMADLVGRLDLLVAQGRATSRLGEDGVWYFQRNAP